MEALAQDELELGNTLLLEHICSSKEPTTSAASGRQLLGMGEEASFSNAAWKSCDSLPESLNCEGFPMLPLCMSLKLTGCCVKRTPTRLEDTAAYFMTPVCRHPGCMYETCACARQAWA